MELIAVKILIDRSTARVQDRPGNVDLALASCLGDPISAALAGLLFGTPVPLLRLRRLCTILLATGARMLPTAIP
ncbi:MAG TPA: hypothetical protein VN708_20465 [Terriglobales bacterium]|jgi:hypothetical protein|nr:hypothetical protein [Terriglobales bacterium]